MADFFDWLQTDCLQLTDWMTDFFDWLQTDCLQLTDWMTNLLNACLIY